MNPRRLELLDKYIDEKTKHMSLALIDLDFDEVIIATVYIDFDILNIAFGEGCIYNSYKIEDYEKIITIYDDIYKLYDYLMDDIMEYLINDSFSYL